MKRLIQIFMLFGMLIFFNAVNAQDRTVSGTIVDQEDNQPLSGVSVLVKGTSRGTTTDADGKFNLLVPAGKNQLEISYAGYQQQTIGLDRGNTVSLRLCVYSVKKYQHAEKHEDLNKSFHKLIV